MIYRLYEQSIDRGAPIECYEFEGEKRTYRYTSCDREVVVGSQTYFPVVIRRENLRVDANNENNFNLEIAIDGNSDLIREYMYQDVPPRKLSLKLYRVHLGTNLESDWILYWSGVVASLEITGRWGKLLVPSTFSRALQTECPNVYYQNSCNHVLYDGRCRAVKANFTEETTVTQTGDLAVTVSSTRFLQNALAAGSITNKRTEENRSIISNVGDRIQITFPFSDIKVGDVVTLLAGCDHSFETCKNKFANTKNYGGFPSIPTDNPFEGKVQ